MDRSPSATARMPLRRSPCRALAPAVLALAAVAAAAPSPLAAQEPDRPAVVVVASADSERVLALAGVVYDSTAARPLAGALLQLSELANPTRALTATTDTLGRYRIGAVRPGRYVAGFIHPTLDVLGLELPMVVVDVAGDSVARLDLAVPGPARVRRSVCGASPAADSAALLVGMVVDAETGMAVEQARIGITWLELAFERGRVRMVPRHVTVPVEPGGRFAACGIPVDADVTATAEAPGRRSGLVELHPTPRGVYRRDFALGEVSDAPRELPPEAVRDATVRAATGRATLSGVVRRVDGTPVERAYVVVIDAAGDAYTRDDGSFSISGLPSGTYTVETRSLGYAPVRATVDLSSRRPATTQLVFDRPAAALERVVVRDRARVRDLRVEGFNERRGRGSTGKFVTAADLARFNAPRLSDALRTVPGLQFISDGKSGYLLRGRGQCVPAIIVDGTPVWQGANDFDLLAPPQSVMGIEVYMGIGSIPVQFARDTNDCGAVLIWTK